MLDTASGCMFMAKKQGSSARDGRGYGDHGIDGEMGQHYGKAATWMKIK